VHASDIEILAPLFFEEKEKELKGKCFRPFQLPLVGSVFPYTREECREKAITVAKEVANEFDRYGHAAGDEWDRLLGEPRPGITVTNEKVAEHKAWFNNWISKRFLKVK